MQIILRQDVDSLGTTGEIIHVKAGYARNFLIPKGLAYMANKANMSIFENERRLNERRQEKDQTDAEALKNKLESASVTISAQVGEEDKLFGSVTSQDIAENLAAQGLEVDKRKFQLEEPIKTLGLYTVETKLHVDVVAKIKVWVVKK